MTRPQILMCPPDHYGIEYEINAWMDTTRQVDHERAVGQWNDLHRILADVGADIVLLTPESGLPDLVFTANAALIFENRAILANFRHAQRQRERPVVEQWFRAAGYHVETLPEEFHFEEAGDALFCGDTLYAGYRIRSDARGHQEVSARVEHRVIPLALVDEYFYHLDACFCPLSADQAIYYPGAFDDYGCRALREHVPELIPVDREEAHQFACNAVVAGRTVVTNTGCRRFHEILRELGYLPVETPLDEFVKAGGSAKCLTLRLDGEDAAGWAGVQRVTNA